MTGTLLERKPDLHIKLVNELSLCLLMLVMKFIPVCPFHMSSESISPGVDTSLLYSCSRVLQVKINFPAKIAGEFFVSGMETTASNRSSVGSDIWRYQDNNSGISPGSFHSGFLPALWRRVRGTWR